MESLIKSDNTVYHLAGIVPVAGQPLDFNMPWPDAMMPIAQDYLAVEKSIWECVLAGCSTVWIVCHMGTIPLLRKRIGDTVVRPISVNISERDDAKLSSRVNIYYIPVHPKDRDRRDSIGWSVLYGANRAYCLCKMISKWVTPEKFFCSFPYGVIDDDTIKNNRKLLLSPKQVIFSNLGKTVKDGIYINFTFDANDFKKARDLVKRYAIDTWSGDSEHIPLSHRKKTLALGVEYIFKNLDLENSSVVESP